MSRDSRYKVEHWITLTNLPASGREFLFEDQGVWQDLWHDAQCDIRVHTPLVATFTVFPHVDGFLIRGRLIGAVESPCHRCMEPAYTELRHDFEFFEAFDDPDELAEEEPRLRRAGADWELNDIAILWEEFLLAMPEKILCADICLGLCPHCGKNKNLEPCACATSDQRSALAAALQRAQIKIT
ncbi:DUF177 domain-containing protein [Desulfovibrionales bacterium]